MLMDKTEDRLELDSRIDELGRVQPWVDALADRHGVAQDTRYAMQLCMEEALANVVLHGYRNQPGHPIVIRSSVADGILFFAIEDQAPPFAPIDPDPQGDARPPASLESIEPGGNGILLMRHFAASVAYEELPGGNRLTLGFSLPSHK
jgi:anti-sigma regulatory factor (Ser/Thr protein kinase)